MTQIVESLFGVSPERYQEQKDAALQQEALAYARLDPLQRATAGIYAGARQLGSGIGRMLGGEDPGMRRVTEQDQIIRSIDLNNPETFGPAAQRAYQMGHTELAQKIMNGYRQQQESSALIGQRQAAAGASKAQAAKNQAETDEIASQIRAFAALTGKPPVVAQPVVAQPVVAQPVTTQPVTTQPIAAEPMVAGPNGIDFYGSPYSVDIRPVEIKSVVPRPSAMDFPPAVPVAPVTEPARSAAAVQLTINQQISELEKKRFQFLSLPKVPAAKAEADILGDQIKELREQGKPTDLSRLESEIVRLRQEGITENDPRIQNRLSKIDKLSGAAERFGPDAETTAKAEFGKSYRLLSQSEAATVNKIVEEKRTERTPKIEVKNVMPGDKNLANVPAFRASVQRTIEPQLKTITATEQALEAINNSLARGNFSDYRAAQFQFARAIAGAGDLSQRELKAAGADPSLLGGAADTISTLFSSTPTNDTQKKMRDTLQAIQTVARKQARREIEQQRKIALRSPGYNAEAVNEALSFEQLQGAEAPRVAAPIYATNGKERIMSTDNGKTWSPVR